MIGLSGSHRTGKTTLAKAYAEKYETPVCVTTTSGVFKKLGYDPQQVYPFDIKMDIQEEVLAELERQYKAVGSRVFIADRTPIDAMGYTLSEVTREKLTDAQEERLAKYINKCKTICNKYFSIVVVVQPGIPLVEDPTKAPIGSGYIEHLSQLIMGITISEGIAASHSYIPRRIIDLEERTHCVRNTFLMKMQREFSKFPEYADENGKVTAH